MTLERYCPPCLCENNDYNVRIVEILAKLLSVAKYVHSLNDRKKGRTFDTLQSSMIAPQDIVGLKKDYQGLYFFN